jgi:signal peptidase II
MNKSTRKDNARIAGLAASIILVDQLTKLLVLKFLGLSDEFYVIRGFFRLVHWGNTGAAWSMFSGNNGLLAAIAIGVVVILVFARHHFDPHTLGGQVALGLIFGGIIGNLIDRLMPSRRHVIDFLYFYVIRRDGSEAGFPAFNVADSAICVGVGLLFILSWQTNSKAATTPSGGPTGR